MRVEPREAVARHVGLLLVGILVRLIGGLWAAAAAGAVESKGVFDRCGAKQTDPPANAAQVGGGNFIGHGAGFKVADDGGKIGREFRTKQQAGWVFIAEEFRLESGWDSITGGGEEDLTSIMGDEDLGEGFEGFEGGLEFS